MPENRNKLTFAIDDNLLGEKVSPENISLPMLEEFVQQVIAFIKGSQSIDLKSIKTEIRNGSFAIAVENDTGLLENVAADYKVVSEKGDLSDIDPRRRAILIEWQRSALRNKDRKYKLAAQSDDEKLSDIKMVITSETQFHFHQETWVDVELYKYGKIYDLGGKTRSNVHLQLEDGHTVKIEANPKLLITDKENRIYKNQLVRISAKQNIQTLEYRDEQLISYEDYNPHFDEDEHKAIFAKARLAWADVKDPVDWVRGLRGQNV